MKTLFILTLFVSLNSLAFADESKKESDKKDKMDYGDKQLLQRDTCRKPIEAPGNKVSGHEKRRARKDESEVCLLISNDTSFILKLHRMIFDFSLL
jgi:hypothetical protein